MSKTPEQLLEYLASLGIRTKTIAHPPLHSVEDSQRLRGEIAGAHVKNLFVKDKKSRLFVITILEDAALDLKQVHLAIGGQGRVSFASADVLEALWGVRPGSVTPFGAINDTQGHVTQVFDARLMAHELMNFHPLTNTMTTTISRADLLAFLAATRHEPVIVELPLQTGSLSLP